MIEVSGLYS